MGQVTDLYVSADIESDGPIPSEYSMLSFGLAVAGSFDGTSFAAAPGDRATFYRELRPISERFDPEALRVSGLDRERLDVDGAAPADAMADAAAWIEQQAGDRTAVMVAYPLGFDWMFLHWYFVRFTGRSPFGFSGALDMKTMYQQKAGVVLGAAGRRDLPDFLVPDVPHTHNALEDAVEQSEIFARLFEWQGGTA